MTTVTLKNGTVLEVPDGCDAEAFRRAQNRKLGAAMSKNTKVSKPKPRRKRSPRKPSKRVNYAAQVIGQAMAELVTRVNQE